MNWNNFSFFSSLGNNPEIIDILIICVSPVALWGSTFINIVYILSSGICCNDRIDLLLHNFRKNSSPYLSVIGGSLFTNLSVMFEFFIFFNELQLLICEMKLCL